MGLPGMSLLVILRFPLFQEKQFRITVTRIIIPITNASLLLFTEFLDSVLIQFLIKSLSVFF
jgi:hypothetical protein